MVHGYKRFLSLKIELKWIFHYCAFFSIISAPQFADGKTYVYKYEAFVMGGLPEEGLARSGVKLLSKVWISAEAENSYTLKVRTI